MGSSDVSYVLDPTFGFVRACVRACVHACMRARAYAREHVHENYSYMVRSVGENRRKCDDRRVALIEVKKIFNLIYSLNIFLFRLTTQLL
jgi:hypothetical protein